MTPIEQWKALKARYGKRLNHATFAVIDTQVLYGWGNFKSNEALVQHIANVCESAYEEGVTFPPQPLPTYERPEPTN